jgi:hypothetical protein
LLREEIGHTVAVASDVEDELRHLIAVLRTGARQAGKSHSITPAWRTRAEGFRGKVRLVRCLALFEMRSFSKLVGVAEVSHLQNAESNGARSEASLLGRLCD